MELIEDRQYKVIIWDTADYERFNSLTGLYYRSALGAIIVFDITNRKSFDNLTCWVEVVKQKTDGNVKILLVGNKNDKSYDAEVEESLAEQFAVENNLCKYISTSALSDENIKEAFLYLLTEIIKAKKEDEGSSVGSISHPASRSNTIGRPASPGSIKLKKRTHPHKPQICTCGSLLV